MRSLVLGAALLAATLGGCVHSRAGAVAAAPPAPATPPAPAAPPAPAPAESAPPPATPRAELPLGGREIFPTYRLVGFCGTPGAPALGRLSGNLPARAKTLQEYAGKYAKHRKVLPLFELIAVVVQSVPGLDGKYRRRVEDAVVDEYLAAARASKAMLLLNIQPGQSDFMTEVRHFERFLREPDVGVALDPEWAMKPKQKPGVYYGQATGATINEVAEYLSAIVSEGDLPEKALVFHQVNAWVLKDESVMKPPRGVVIIKSVDGLGPKGAKINTYKFLVKTMNPGVHAGFKLFFEEDRHVMSPDEVLALLPEPEYVMYE
jgi:hypothetical protein